MNNQLSKSQHDFYICSIFCCKIILGEHFIYKDQCMLIAYDEEQLFKLIV